MPVQGVAHVDVVYGGQAERLPLVVVEGEGSPLPGKYWMCRIKIDWDTLFHSHVGHSMPTHPVKGAFLHPTLPNFAQNGSMRFFHAVNTNLIFLAPYDQPFAVGGDVIR